VAVTVKLPKPTGRRRLDDKRLAEMLVSLARRLGEPADCPELLDIIRGGGDSGDSGDTGSKSVLFFFFFFFFFFFLLDSFPSFSPFFPHALTKLYRC
jgi:hypothetical protein